MAITLTFFINTLNKTYLYNYKYKITV